MKVIYAAAALADMRAIGRFIQADRPLHAKRFVRDLKSACESLRVAPLAYPRLSRFADLGLRKRSFRAYLIFYRVAENIEVFRIIHGARDYQALLRGENG